MDNPFFVGCGQAVGHLYAVLDSFANWERTAQQLVAQGAAFQQLGNQVGRAFMSSQLVDRQNIGVIQSCGGRVCSVWGFVSRPSPMAGNR